MGRQTNAKDGVKTIIHLDMDSFYPSIEILDNPRLKGKPVIVGGTSPRGVVASASASYEARKFGVRSAQPMATARRLCPHGIFLPVRMSRYKEMSKRVFALFRLFSPLVEPVSIDEAFLDVSGSKRLFGPPKDMAKRIKHIVCAETGLTVSAGVAPSKFVAKIASDMDKPDGLTFVTQDRVLDFLAALSIHTMWGVGKKTQEGMHRLGIQTIGDLRRFPVDVLEKKFGKHGIKMHQLALGIDERSVVPAGNVKSVGNEQTFSKDILQIDAAKKELLSLANKVARRMRHEGVLGKTVTLKVKYSDFVQITRSNTLAPSTDDGHEIYETACRLLEKTYVVKRPVRLLGVSMSQLRHSHSGEQLGLFHKSLMARKRKDLNAALDTIAERFGADSIGPARLLKD